jgi:hypothetical protein
LELAAKDLELLQFGLLLKVFHDYLLNAKAMMRNNMFQKYYLLKCNAVGTGRKVMKLEPKDCGNRKVFLEDVTRCSQSQ